MKVANKVVSALELSSIINTTYEATRKKIQKFKTITIRYY